ncbi:MAG: hypothetical protein ABUL66_01580 [Verrucomicrobiota bacterium]
MNRQDCHWLRSIFDRNGLGAGTELSERGVHAASMPRTQAGVDFLRRFVLHVEAA